MTTVQEFKCIFCKEEFDDKETLQIHFRKHGDPQFNQSKVKTRPQYAAQNSGEQSKDGTEMVGCDVCSEVFPTISKAITHKHKVHPDHDAKYFCPWCGKLFTLKHLYNKHLIASHDNKEDNGDRPFHCDSCEVHFNVPMAMLYHNKFFHRQDTDIPSFGHSKKLKMHNQEVLQIYYCSFCGEEYVNKVNLHKHTVDDHSDENQSPDEVLRCPLCDAIFYHLDAYEVHLTFHSVQDLYSETNDLMKDITEFSLEAVPPSTEKVENCEAQQDAETTMAEMSFEDILQMAAEQSGEQMLKKSKKHKKHKKSKKSAITLNEFLNMNKDVFGEGLDFQGVEEVPTQVITKRLKVNKKSQNLGLKATPELDKLRKQGIIVKKKTAAAIINPHSMGQNILANKSKYNTKLSSSKEMLSKLISQSNNEIQINKKGGQTNTLNLCEVIFKEESSELPASVFDNENIECDSTKKELGETSVDSIVSNKMKECMNKCESEKLDNSNYNEKNTLQDSQDTLTTNPECPSSSVSSNKDTQLKDIKQDHNLSCHDTNENYETAQTNTIVSLNASSSKKVSDLTKNRQNTVNISSSDSAINSNIHMENDIELELSEKLICSNTVLPTKLQKGTGSSTNDSLSALKHLSHLITVKPVQQSKNALDDVVLSSNKNVYNKLEAVEKTSTETSVTSTNDYKETNDISSKTDIGTLKNAGKKFTTKFIPQKLDDFKMKHTDASESDVDEDEFTKQLSDNEICNQHAIEELCGSPTNPLKIKVDANAGRSEHHIKNTDNLPYNTESKNSSQLLKHLTSITAKPFNMTNSVNRNSSTYSLSPRNKAHRKIPQTVQKIVANQDDIEILNIADSDSDDMENSNHKADPNISVNPMCSSKNLDKNIIVKQENLHNLESFQNVTVKNASKNIMFNETQMSESKECVNVSKTVPNSLNSRLGNQKNVAIKNVLKALGKNITVKSKNASPIHVVKHHGQNLENNDDSEDNHADSETDSCSGRVKISEVCDEEATEEETKHNLLNENAIIEMPDDACSDNETNAHENENSDDHESDFESHIKLNTLEKPDSNLQTFKITSLSSIINMGKDITIKSSNDHSNREQVSKPIATSDSSQSSGQISLKPMRQNKIDHQENNSNNVRQVKTQKISINSGNQKMNSSNQVNKEVTVKTFQTQTQTVIQEITTTVTKTIKTVNQTVNEELRNSSQSITTPTMPHRSQGIRIIQNPKNFQGITVRHAVSSGVSPKINTTPLRPIGSNMTIRPSNQLVSCSTPRQPNQMARTGINVARLSIPRMPGQQKIRSAIGNTQSPQLGKPLKISQSAIVSPGCKRPSSAETVGPFSCFKKSKESLIPVSETPTFGHCDETKMEHSSSMQMSKSNVISTVKTFKGNSVVTSTQMRSEMSAASSQHLSKLSGMSGIKVVKTSQNRQVHETNENSSGMKQTTLDVIQKLQKQGLLVKKPRLDHSEESEHSDAGGDDNLDHSSVDENND